MKRKTESITQILCDREHGYPKNLNSSLYQIGLEHAELALMDRMMVEKDMYKQILDDQNEQESVFNIEQSHDGKLAATVQTNRSINIYKVSTMKKICELRNNERSVWTIDFHPTNRNLIAVGTLGGQVIIFYSMVEIGRYSETDVNSIPISSICFHPTEDYVIFSSDCNIKVYDYQNNAIKDILYAYTDCKVRYLKFSPSTRMLITGISKTSDFVSVGIGKNLITCEWQYLINSFLRTINLILDCLEYTTDLTYEVNKKIHLWNYLMKTIVYKLVDVQMEEVGELKYHKKELNLTFKIVERRLDKILSHATGSVMPNSTTDDDVKGYYTDVLTYFQKLLDGLLIDKDGNYFRYFYNIKTVENVLYKICLLFYKYASRIWEQPCEYNYEYYLKHLYTKNIADKLDIHYQRNCRLAHIYTLQAWEWENYSVPDLREDWKNVITSAKINNDSTIAISKCGKLIASVVAGNLGVLEVRSLMKENLGECIATFTMVHSFVSLSFSPSGRYLLVGLRSGQKNKFSYVLDIDVKKYLNYNADKPTARISQILFPPTNSTNYNEVNCIKWMTLPGYGLILGLKSQYLKTCRPF